MYTIRPGHTTTIFGGVMKLGLFSISGIPIEEGWYFRIYTTPVHNIDNIIPDSLFRHDCSILSQLFCSIVLLPIHDKWSTEVACSNHDRYRYIIETYQHHKRCQTTFKQVHMSCFVISYMHISVLAVKSYSCAITICSYCQLHYMTLLYK